MQYMTGMNACCCLFFFRFFGRTLLMRLLPKCGVGSIKKTSPNPVDEVRAELHMRQLELERRSNLLVEALQEQDRLRKAADELQIRAHQVCECKGYGRRHHDYH
jgi:hypothetical protein